MSSKLLLALALLFTLEGMAQGQDNLTDVSTVTLEQSIHFVTADGSDVIIEPGHYQVEAAEEWLRVIPGERRDALLLEASATTHKEYVSQPLVRLIPGGENQVSLALLLPNGRALEAFGSSDGVRSRAVKRGQIARAPVPQKNVARRQAPSTKQPTTKKPSGQPLPLTQQVYTLNQQVQSLQGTIASLQQTITSLNNRLATIEGVIHIANNGNVTIGQLGKVTIQGSEVEMNTSLVDVNAATSNFSGTITTSHITTDSIASKTYTPGAGNIW